MQYLGRIFESQDGTVTGGTRPVYGRIRHISYVQTNLII